MLFEPLEILRTHSVRAPEVERPNCSHHLADRMMRPLYVRCSLRDTRGRLNTEFAQAIKITADKVICDPFLPLILVGPKADRCAIFRLPAYQRVERLVRVPEMSLQRLVDLWNVLFVTENGEQRTISVSHMPRLI